MSDKYPPPPNRFALTQSIQSTNQSTEQSFENDNYGIKNNRPSVLDIAGAFQKMEDKLKHQSKRKIKSPKKYATFHRNKSTHRTYSKSSEPDERSDVLMNKLKEFNDRKEETNTNTITKLQESLREKMEEIGELQSLIGEQQKSFKNRFASFKHQDKKIKRMSTEMRGTLAQKNTEIRTLTTQLRNNVSKEKDFQKQIKTLQDAVESTDHKNKLYEKQIETYKQKLYVYNNKINELSNEKRLEDHVLNIANSDDLNTEIETLKAELSKLKGEKMSDIIKIEKWQISSQSLKNELNEIKQQRLKTKRDIDSNQFERKNQKKKPIENLKKQMDGIREQFSFNDITNSDHDADADKMQLQPKRKSVFAEAVHSLNSLFSEPNKSTNATPSQVSYSYPVENAKSNLAKLLENSPIIKHQSAEYLEDDSCDKNEKAIDPHSVHQAEQIQHLHQQLHNKEDELQHKEEILSRLSEENKIFRQQIFDLRDQLHYEEKLNEMNKSQHHMEGLLETLYSERKQHNKHMKVLGKRLSQIMEQNNSLRQSINAHYQHEHKERDDDNRTSTTETETSTIHAIPISMRAMKSRRFSEVFLQQLQSPEHTNDTSTNTALFNKYINDKK